MKVMRITIKLSSDNDTNNNSNKNYGYDSKSEALYYRSQGFNVIAIPKPGEKIAQTRDKQHSKFMNEIADGKSVRVYESWNELRTQGLTKENVAKHFGSKLDCNPTILTVTALGVLAFDIDGEKYVHRRLDRRLNQDYFKGYKPLLDF